MSAFPDFLRVNLHWLAAGVLLMFASSFGQTFFISIFAGEIRAAFGLSHGGWGGIYTLATTASAAVMVFAGGLTDRLRVRVLGAGAIALLAIACVAMSLATTLWTLIVVIFALRLFGQGMMSHIAMTAMARWFVASRGRALSIATLGVATGEALLPVSFVALMGVLPWRGLWLLAAGFLALLGPMLYVLLRRERTPQATTGTNSAPGMLGRDWTRNEVLRHWLFWLMVPGILGPAAFNTAFFFHQVHLAESKGWEHVALVALFPAYTSVNVAAMLGSGWLIDRFGTGRIMPFYLLPIGAAYVVLAGAGTLSAALVSMALMGVSVGMAATLSSAFWAEFFGTRNLGAIRALTTAVMVFGTALGPGATGVLIDLGIMFEDQMYGIALWFAVASALAAAGVRRARPLLVSGSA